MTPKLKFVELRGRKHRERAFSPFLKMFSNFLSSPSLTVKIVQLRVNSFQGFKDLRKKSDENISLKLCCLVNRQERQKHDNSLNLHSSLPPIKIKPLQTDDFICFNENHFNTLLNNKLLD